MLQGGIMYALLMNREKLQHWFGLIFLFLFKLKTIFNTDVFVSKFYLKLY